MLTVEGLNAWYGQSQALHDVALAVPEGGRVALLGRNGAGKSTTLRTIMGLWPASAGELRFHREGRSEKLNGLSTPDIAARGIKINLVPGILPITNLARVSEFARKCGASIPPELARRFAGLEDDVETRNLVAAMVAADQVHALAREGVTDFHFYTLNRADLVYAICRVLGLGAPVASEEAA